MMGVGFSWRGMALLLGWTSAGQQTVASNRTAILWRYATSSDPASWNFGSSSATEMAAAIVAYRSATPSAPVAVTSSGNRTLQTSHPIPNVTTTSDANLLVHAAGFGSNPGTSVPSGVNNQATVSSPARLVVMDRELLDPAPSQAKSVGSSAVANSASVTVAIKPVAETVRFGHTGHNDTSQYAKNTAGDLVDVSVPLPGGTTYTYTPTTWWMFSHADLHGDTIAQTNLAGTYTWSGLSGPYGEPASATTAPNSTPADTTKTWHGGDGKLTDSGIVHMGARPYSPTHGRFLAVDPIEGGCANNYTYVHGDPINSSDLTGMGGWGGMKDALLRGGSDALRGCGTPRSGDFTAPPAETPIFGLPVTSSDSLENQIIVSVKILLPSLQPLGF